MSISASCAKRSARVKGVWTSRGGAPAISEGSMGIGVRDCQSAVARSRVKSAGQYSALQVAGHRELNLAARRDEKLRYQIGLGFPATTGMAALELRVLLGWWTPKIWGVPEGWVRENGGGTRLGGGPAGSPTRWHDGRARSNAVDLGTPETIGAEIHRSTWDISKKFQGGASQ